MQTQTVNDYIIKTYSDKKKQPFKYSDLLSHPFCCILVIGPKNTGKSVITGNIILNTVCNKTVVRIFSTTMEADQTTTKTIQKLEKRNIDVEKYTDIKEKTLFNQLLQIKKFVENKDIKQKLENMKYAFPLVFYCFDDFREKFKEHPEISNLFTKNRHYRSLLLVSSQRYKDIQPCARGNTQVLILTAGVSDLVLKSIYEEQPIHISFDEFKYIYQMATSKKYDFLFCDLENGKFRINMNEEIIF